MHFYEIKGEKASARIYIYMTFHINTISRELTEMFLKYFVQEERSHT